MMGSAQKAEKFLFDRPFDEPESQAELDPNAPEAPAGLTNAELAELRAQAYEAGREEGLSEAKASLEATTATTMKTIQEDMTRLINDCKSLEREITGDAARLAQTIGTKLAGRLMTAHPLAEIERLVAESLREVRGEPRLVIRLHDQLVDSLKERIDALSRAEGFEGSIILLGDDGLGPLDCRVEWANGGAERRMQDLVEAAKNAVNRYVETMSSSPKGNAEAPADKPDEGAAEADASAAPGDAAESETQAETVSSAEEVSR